jgi:hypothetical protein
MEEKENLKNGYIYIYIKEIMKCKKNQDVEQEHQGA